MTKDIPTPVGPYSLAIQSNGFIFLSGQVGLASNGTLAGNTIELQTQQTFRNIDAILKDNSCSIKDVVKVTIFLTNIEDFNKVNRLYKNWVADPSPARSTIGVAKLPLNALIEIECIAKLTY